MSAIGYAEQQIINEIQMLNLDKKRLETLYIRLQGITYRITPTYSLTAGGGMSTDSKIERMLERKETIIKEIREIESRVVKYYGVLESGILTDQEQAIVKVMMNGQTLAEYARAAGIYRSTVYKIRDRAVKKISRVYSI